MSKKQTPSKYPGMIRCINNDGFMSLVLISSLVISRRGRARARARGRARAREREMGIEIEIEGNYHSWSWLCTECEPIWLVAEYFTRTVCGSGFLKFLHHYFLLLYSMMVFERTALREQ